MAVYREAFDAVKKIERNSGQVFKDACDYGAPVKVGDLIWEAIQTLKGYHDPETDKIYRSKGYGWFEVEVVDEWAVSDRRATWEEATTKLKVSYQSLKHFPTVLKNSQYLNADGFVEICKM